MVKELVSKERSNNKKVLYPYNTIVMTSKVIDAFLIAAGTYMRFNSPYVIPNTNLELLGITRKYFNTYNSHPFVQSMKEHISKQDIDLQTVGIMLCHTDYPYLSPFLLCPDVYYTMKIKNLENLIRFLNSLKKFYQDSSVDSFFENNIFSQQDFGRVKESIRNGDLSLLISEMEKYIGAPEMLNGKKVLYRIVLTVFRRRGNFFHGYLGDNNIVFTSLQYIHSFDVKCTQSLIEGSLHEFLHLYINDIVRSHNNSIQRYCSSRQKIEFTSRQAYLERPWNRLVDECLVRAIAARILARLFGKERAYKSIIEPESLYTGFVHLECLFEKLSEYEENRTQYTSIKDFIPELIKEMFTR